MFEPDFNNMEECDSCHELKLKLHKYQGKKLCDECCDKLDNREVARLKEIIADLKLRMINILESNIRDKQKRIKLYDRMASGETFEPKDDKYYLERKEVLKSEIEGHKNTILQIKE